MCFQVLGGGIEQEASCGAEDKMNNKFVFNCVDL